MHTTIEIPLESVPIQQMILHEQARELSRLERALFVDLYVEKSEPNATKRAYLDESNPNRIPGRLYNAILFALKGKILAWEEAEKLVIENLQEKLKKLKKQRNDFQNKVETYPSQAQVKKPWIKGFTKTKNSLTYYRTQVHLKKRKISSVEVKLAEHQTRLKSAVPSICFGSRALFKKQYHLKENSFKDHAAWKEVWDFTRSSQFFVMGSSDEKAGCANAQWDFLEGTVRLKIIDKIAKVNTRYLDKHGYIVLNTSKIPEYGKAKLIAAQESGKPISTRFVLRKDKRGNLKTVAMVSFEEVALPMITQKLNGALGVDLNARSVALAWMKADGNLLRSATLHFDLTNKSSEQSEALLTDVVMKIVMAAVASKIPLAVEALDFQKKKRTLVKDKVYNQMLSSFAYNKFYQVLIRIASRHGVEVKTVNPAYTSIIGFCKFGALRHSVDESAALAIARRSFGFTECFKTTTRAPALRTKMMQCSKENSLRHVGSSWKCFASWLGKSRKGWASRCSRWEQSPPSKSDSSQGIVETHQEVVTV